MNLNASPTKQELKQLIAACDDRAGHHVLWVDANGAVHVSRVPKDLSPVGFQESKPDMRLRYETFQKGNEYVGPAAAEDDEWASRLFDSLLKEWQKAKAKNGTEYVNLF